MITKLTKPEDALSLPKGRLVALGMFEASFTDRNVYECAELIVKADVNEKFFSQAEIVAYAGNELGWGQGKPYRTM
jgi:hypothetical protein